jgi:hypothetical protein
MIVSTSCHGVHLEVLSPFESYEMTFTETKNHDATSAQTAQQHHLQAAEQLELAAKSHKEAAKLMGSGDQSGAQIQVEKAKTYSTQATEHVTEAAKKNTGPAKVPA